MPGCEHRGARQWDGTAAGATPIIDWILASGGTARYHDDPVLISVDVPEGTVAVLPGYWVVRTLADGFRPYGPDVFTEMHCAADSGRRTVYVSIGNSDDKLPQQRWHEFWVSFRNAVMRSASQVHGEWLSIGYAPYQNACICFEIDADRAPGLKDELSTLAGEFGQDSIAWAEARTDFIKPVHP